MDIVTRIKIWTGACSAAGGIEDIRATVERSRNVLWLAEQGSDLSKNLQNAAKVFRNAKEGLSKVEASLDFAENRRLDFCALADIHAAIKVLNQDGVIQKNPEAAAKAFGKLFSGFGRLAQHLPPPANSYAPVLEACGGDFFNGMRKKINASERWKKQFEQIDGFVPD